MRNAGYALSPQTQPIRWRSDPLETDFLIIGSGLAGLSLALRVSTFGEVLIVSKAKLQDGNNSWLAQGGIAAAVSHEDSVENHIRDTLMAGAGLCDARVVRHVAQQGPDRVNDLIHWGVRFDTNSSGFSLTREGGHSYRRILHIEDHTGREIHKTLLQQAKSCPRITFLENHLAIDLITKKKITPSFVGHDSCLGAHVLSQTTGEIISITARTTTLATGGAGKVYLYTSNWSGATGDGIAMAHRAGARVKDLEFMQFHPTCLYHPQSRNFLISEALRGEGGRLINFHGQPFTDNHPLGDLAPRDIVARFIDAEIKKTGAECVYLDMTHKSEKELASRFPVIFNRCRQLGVNISTDPIPVVPAAHYLCGGVITDLNGRTDIHSLFALGETACTGLHGANRLASNSLLECVVFSANAANYMKDHLTELKAPQSLSPFPYPPSNNKEDISELVVISHMWDEIRRLMWNYMGIVRSHRRLARAQYRLQNIRNEITEYYSNFKTDTNIVELRNIAIVADLSILCALNRKQSVGIHYNLDDPPSSYF